MALKMSIAGMCVVAAAWALGGEIEPLWPEGKIPDFRPNQIAAPSQDAKQPGFDPAAHRMPYLEWCEAPAAAVKKDACMILISGGGYNNTCDGPAFKAFERRFLKEGITCVYVWYRTPRPSGLPIYQTAWEDGQRAVRLVRAQAKKRGFNPEKIGAMGCSAGSHLTVMLATSALTPAYQPVDDFDKLPCHINWAIPHCTAYALDDGLDKANVNKGEGAKLNPSFKFDAKTCPMCLFHGGLDPYSPLGSTRICRRLREMKIPVELHLDGYRMHGVCRIERFERAIEFMRQMGYLGKLEKEKAADHRFMPTYTIRTEKELIWPEGKMPDVNMNQSAYQPYLVWFTPEKLKTKAIQVILPGGGYSFCNFNGEGTPVAHYLNEKGMTAVVVMYRCPRPPEKAKHLSAWQDAQRAIRMVRAEAPVRGLDPNRIGVMGFSAGGHLSLMCATTSKTPAYAPVDDVDKLSCSVQWAFPVYPAYVLLDGENGVNQRGGNLDEDAFVPDFAFDDATPPMCFNHGDADVISCMGSVKVWEELRRRGLQSDLHTYALRPHCFQIRSSPGTGSFTWLDRVWDFLEYNKFNR